MSLWMVAKGGLGRMISAATSRALLHGGGRKDAHRHAICSARMQGVNTGSSVRL
jgi:hypothetical protein